MITPFGGAPCNAAVMRVAVMRALHGRCALPVRAPSAVVGVAVDPLVDPVIAARDVLYRAPVAFGAFVALAIFLCVDCGVDAVGGAGVDCAFGHFVAQAVFEHV